ncbi:Penicillin-binding protein 2 (PBP-2) [Roseibacterium elongatum DSM 19469]|uniref:Penicillin-binding protein 2 (PBP-2) n=1 Tax=Roseicyclus elongatus DSM 19469 TaxID=1294273 RepID=W8S2K6_9RHOB|nr:penicillin-binding protein 2 [Roseibacterium elongatum]AHM02961.1 Penicillin-binding protein 2 (PBP-2) [Roseibacterium elongatum DSM 19469]
MKRTQGEMEFSARTIGRRSVVLGGLFVATGGILAARMRHLQVERADDFRLLAEENRINIRLLPPARGLIFDRSGVLLAGNEQNYRITLVREDAGDVDAVLAELGRVVNLDLVALERAREEISRRPPFVPVTVADRLSWEELSSVAVNAPALPGVNPEVGLSRVYPMGADFAHVVGYVGPVSDYYLDQTGDTDPVLQIPDFQVGRYNVEARLEQPLRGSAGSRRVEVNAGGRVMRELDRDPATPGSDVQLTIDAGLQNYVEARLSDQSAGAVVMDCQTGEVLAVASAPTFDPNLFVRGISTTQWRGLNEDPYRPLANKATQGLYPPGSTYKMIVALAGLEAGVLDPDETVTCTGSIELGNRRFHCWKRGGHGRVNLIESLSQSCDVFYYDLAQRVGIEAISAMAVRLGCGIRHDLPLSGIAEGLAPTMAWKRANRGADWVVGDTLNASIGQGFVLTSPLQLAVMTARLATGRAITPWLVRSIDGVPEPRPEAADLGLSAENLALIHRGMWAATNDRRGTAFGSRVMEDAYAVAGKTGTSQVRNITAAERAAGVIANEDLPWERRDHALYVGYAPSETPRYAVSVVVEHGGGGAAVAAPIARDILLRAQVGDVPPPALYPVSQRREIEEMHRRLPILPEPPRPSGREATRRTPPQGDRA